MKKTMLALLCGLLPMGMSAQTFEMNDEAPNNPNNEPRPCHPVPSERQILWNETEFYAFYHYGMNTFTGKEWGNGDEQESLYNPLGKPDPEQWVTSVKAAGMRGGIAVVKHHDGFCLWPTSTTEHNITKGSGAYHNTNIADEFAKASKKHKMKYGFYVSPWDCNSIHYGTDKYVTDVFLKQCEELATYGSDQFEMWFDGANGGKGYYGGRNTNVSVDASIYYDIPNLRAKVHTIAPNCVMWGVGNEARWIGNEAGYSGVTCWAMGDRESGDINGWYWHPGESDAKATSGGWFWHSGETMKSSDLLFKTYLETVGRNATFILNCPPNNYGILPDATVNELKALGQKLHDRLGLDVYGITTPGATDYAKTATITANEERTGGNYQASLVADGNKDTYWAVNDESHTGEITFEWDAQKTIRYVVLQEPIRLGQRVKDFKIEYSTDGNSWTELASGITTTIGYKRIIPLNGDTANSYGTGYKAKKLRISITDSRACPLISNINIF
ncbi:MAG: alpha-L-fucosidase [Bacteroidales bacterium]|nr:alpha-L-fucosidase [Candidatus Physcousia equi]